MGRGEMIDRDAGRAWTKPRDLRVQVKRLWDRGAILSDIVDGGDLFPRRLVLKRPTSAELLDNFESARAWSASLRAARNIRLTIRGVRHRVLGANALPHEAWVDTAEDAATMIGKRPELARFHALLEAVGTRQPTLLPWVAKKPLRALELESEWNGLLDTVEWLQRNSRPGIYLRQMDVAGVDTKFVESHRGVLGELLDIALPSNSIDASHKGAAHFESRYGFRSKPERVRIRVLDPACLRLPWCDEEGCTDLTLTASGFSALETEATTAIITENEINFLALPPMKRTIAIFSAGYGCDGLAQAQWLERCGLHYWGDIDTHGFAILDEFRSHFETVKSLLMDRETFLAFRPLWVTEPSPTDRSLKRLNESEKLLYDDLRTDTYGSSVRLEQERIAFSWVRNALRALVDPD